MLRALADAGGKAIGGARFSLTSVMPGVLLVTVITAIARAGLYDVGAKPDFSDVAPSRQDTAAVALFIFFAFVVGVLLRPFEAAVVQLLEGYWERPSPLAPLRGAAVERHRRRRDRAQIAIQHSEEVAQAERQAASLPTGNRPPAGSVSLSELAEQDRRAARRRRVAEQAERIRSGYPTEVRPEVPGDERDPDGELMPTTLGNMLRRAERLSGDRYGLDMMVVYPRIYPFIAPRLESAVTQQLSLIAATASLAVSLGITTLAMLPLLLRWDAWSLLPLTPAILTVLAYRGATAAADFHGTLLSTVFDVHRFDLAKAFHYKLPESTEQLTVLNKKISDFITQDTARLDEEMDRPLEHQPESDDVLHRANSNGPAET
ncbi:hypothetical protein ACIBO9_19565 [Streptomyces prunicolor]|uniref:hypothetical protein n=1 Tax=Streptomyces prunicolor TaxID=67348 RepID=UPI0037D78323